ncbi:MAG: hypothetical protein J7K49_04960 [Thaumarchaeota archaeon]|nr:hypothetical protein [Nitrososphaerota archaeon]
MNKKQTSLLTLTMIALLVSIINGIFDIAYNMQRTFEASVTNDYGESLNVKVVADSGRPPLLSYLGYKLHKSWWLAWRVGTTPVSTVNIGVTITPTATNVVNLKVTYYIKAKSGASQYNPLSGSNIPATSGSPLSYSTGSMSIDSHLTDLGVSTTQDQTVDYYVYCKVEGDGAISGEHLVAEVPETKFDTITFDYGGTVTDTFELTPSVTVRLGYDKEGDTYEKTTSGNTLGIGTSYSYTHEHRIGAVEFNIGAVLPSDATILSNPKFKYYVYDEWGSTVLPYIRSLPNRPSQQSASTAFDMVETNYLHQLGQFPDDENGWYTVDLGTQGKTDLQNKLSSGWFCLGFYAGRGTTSAGTAFYTTYAGYEAKLIFDAEYTDWSLSWSWFNLPLSIVSLPVGQQFLAIVFMILAFAVWVAAREKAHNSPLRRRKK